MSTPLIIPEILEQILSQALPDWVDIPIHADDPHSIVAQVCRRWQATLISTPTLWTRLHATFKNPLKVEQVIEASKSYLSRSRECLVTLRADIMVPGEDLPDDIVRKVILPFAARWQELDLQLPKRSFNILLNLPPNSFPNLEHVAILTLDTKSEDLPRGIIIPTGASVWPHLSSVEYQALDYESFNAWKLNCPWGDITRMDLGPKISLECCYGILQQCRLLEEFSAAISLRRSFPPTSQPIILPHLISLTIEDRTWREYFPTFLTPLVTPKLEKITFISRKYLPVSPAEFRAFQVRSQFQLKELFLAPVRHRNIAAFIDILACCPSLLKLIVHNDKALVGSDDLARGVILPKLEHLVLLEGLQPNSELLAMVDFRTRPEYSFPLKRLHGGYRPIEDPQGLETFINRGLEVKWG